MSHFFLSCPMNYKCLKSFKHHLYSFYLFHLQTCSTMHPLLWLYLLTLNTFVIWLLYTKAYLCSQTEVQQIWSKQSVCAARGRFRQNVVATNNSIFVSLSSIYKTNIVFVWTCLSKVVDYCCSSGNDHFISQTARREVRPMGFKVWGKE